MICDYETIKIENAKDGGYMIWIIDNLSLHTNIKSPMQKIRVKKLANFERLQEFLTYLLTQRECGEEIEFTSEDFNEGRRQ